MFHFRQYSAPKELPLIMGIVNATGDSFSEGPGSAPESALDRALRLLADGADLLDIGGESTRPGAREIPPVEEIDRILPVIRGVRAACPDAVLSVDTRKSEVAAAAIECGVEIINDVSMLRYDAALARVTAEGGAALVLSHSRGTPETMRSSAYHDYGADVVATVAAELAAAKRTALEAGVAEENLIFDPGIGFAKTPEQDWELLRRSGELRRLGPVLVGMSRKSFLGKFLNRPDPADRLGGTIAAALHLAGCGVEILRVHDVRQLRDALLVRAKLQE